MNWEEWKEIFFYHSRKISLSLLFLLHFQFQYRYKEGRTTLSTPYCLSSAQSCPYDLVNVLPPSSFYLNFLLFLPSLPKKKPIPHVVSTQLILPLNGFLQSYQFTSFYLTHILELLPASHFPSYSTNMWSHH